MEMKCRYGHSASFAPVVTEFLRLMPTRYAVCICPVVVVDVGRQWQLPTICSSTINVRMAELFSGGTVVDSVGHEPFWSLGP